jgi:hypothetical protein
MEKFDGGVGCTNAYVNARGNSMLIPRVFDLATKTIGTVSQIVPDKAELLRYLYLVDF